MIPATLDLAIYQGDSFDRVIRIKELILNTTTGQYEPGDYVDLTGATARAQIRIAPDSTDIEETFVCTLLDQTDPTLVGGFSISLTPLQTAELTPGIHVWDFEVTDTFSKVNTYLAGAVKVRAEVTR